MSNRAEAALEERYKSNPRHTPSHHYYKRGFLDGYAAATADTEAQVRAAVEATIEEAAKVANRGYILPGLDADVNGHYGNYVTVNTSEVAQDIRALDPEPIVRRVMQQ